MNFSPTYWLILAGITGMLTTSTTLAAPAMRKSIFPDDAAAWSNATAVAAAALADSLVDALTRTSSEYSAPNSATDSLSLSTAFSATTITWNGGSSSCAASPQMVTISCGTGGIISILFKSGPSTCQYSGSSTLKCTKPSTSTAPSSVGVKCLKSYRPTATLASKTFASCSKSDTNKYAIQLMTLDQYCNGASGSYSSSCGGGSTLRVQSGVPLCYSASSTCKSTSTTKCSITTGGVSITAPKLCINNL